jgi:hypothetical protein
LIGGIVFSERLHLLTEGTGLDLKDTPHLSKDVAEVSALRHLRSKDEVCEPSDQEKRILTLYFVDGVKPERIAR